MLWVVKVQCQTPTESTQREAAHVCGRLVESQPVGVHGLLGAIGHPTREEVAHQDRVTICVSSRCENLNFYFFYFLQFIILFISGHDKTYYSK